MKYLITTGILLSYFIFTIAQVQPAYTPFSERETGPEVDWENSFVKNLSFQSVGPRIFNGRVTDIEVNPVDPTEFYVAYASGGLWKTTNNGTSFSPLFDKEDVITIGDIAVNWTTGTIWVGTGEVNSSRSSYAGMGVYKSNDGGKSWDHLGLGESHHIGRIILHPNDTMTAWVAVLGHLYSPSADRGIYKTSNGGRSWTQSLFVNDNTGTVDLILDPKNSDHLFAASWERTRRAWNFEEAGSGSGIHESKDGGKTWSLVTTKTGGFPFGETVGRIGINMTYHNNYPVLYAFVDNYARREKEQKDDEEALEKDDFRKMSKQTFAKLDEERLESFLRKNNFPKKYTAKKVKEMVAKEEVLPIAIIEFLNDANSLLFDTKVIGGEVYKSVDFGRSWKKTHEGYLDDLCYSYGYYFGQIRIDPQDHNGIYIMGVPILKSKDGGATWTSINKSNVHVDHHALWINPNRQGHLILGNDGGVNISYDDGESWLRTNPPPVGQFYTVQVDMAKPYNIYGGTQDNGVWMGPSGYEASPAYQASGHYPYKMILGGDGMQVAVDSRDNNTVYTGYQFGNYFRVNVSSGNKKYITPIHDLGQRPYRWNWQTPIHLSIHNEDILYMGANKVFRSMNKGDKFKAISEDLTGGGQKGDVAYGTLTTIHESPLRFGLLYAGSDDGHLHVSRDGGFSWDQIYGILPEKMWVSRVQASSFEEGRVYLSLNGYRWDDFRPYVYVSEDYGKTWKNIQGNLPYEPVNVIKEDTENENILYIGTDNGIYISFDRGLTYMPMGKDLPRVAVHDLVVHPREKDLIIGTHGRSIYKTYVGHLQKLRDSITSEELYVFEATPATYDSHWGKKSGTWGKVNEPEYMIAVFCATGGKLKLEVSLDNAALKSWEIDVEKGLNYVPYNLSVDKKNEARFKRLVKEKEMVEKEAKSGKNGTFYLVPGVYDLSVKKGRAKKKVSVEIKTRGK